MSSLTYRGSTKPVIRWASSSYRCARSFSFLAALRVGVRISDISLAVSIPQRAAIHSSVPW